MNALWQWLTLHGTLHVGAEIHVDRTTSQKNYRIRTFCLNHANAGMFSLI